MGTFTSGVSTSGLASSPDPQIAFSRRQTPGEYEVRITLSSGGKLELIVTRHSLVQLASLMTEIGKHIDKDFSEWQRELIEIRQFGDL